MSYSTKAELYTHRKIPIEKALEKIYLVKARKTSGYLSLPNCLVGKRIKIQIVGDVLEEKNENKDKN